MLAFCRSYDYLSKDVHGAVDHLDCCGCCDGDHVGGGIFPRERKHGDIAHVDRISCQCGYYVFQVGKGGKDRCSIKSVCTAERLTLLIQGT